MKLRRAATLTLTLLALSLPLSACHVAGHMTPGQIKHAVNPPPGHGGLPPGQAKKI